MQKKIFSAHVKLQKAHFTGHTNVTGIKKKKKKISSEKLLAAKWINVARENPAMK